MIMFPISGQWKEEGAHHKFLIEMGTLLYSLILYKFPTKSCLNLSRNWRSPCEIATVTYFLSFYWGFVHSEKDWNLLDLLPGNTP